MKKLVLLVAIAVIGVAFAGWSVLQGHRAPPTAQPIVAPATSSFAATVAGAGLVEPAEDVVHVSAPVGEIIATVVVKPGDKIAAGTPLLTLDARAVRAQEQVQLAALVAATAALQAARIGRDEAADNASRAREGLMSIEERSRRTFAASSATARLIQAEAALTQAEVALSAIRVELDRRIVRAPRAGTILRVDARPGEFAPAGRIDPPLITMGDVDNLQLRVDIDENDAWRVAPGSPAEGAVRGNPELRTPLAFVRIEPYVVPKKSLTGLSAERVDTRVLQIIYRITRSDLRMYAGQQMDVFIDAAARSGSGTVP